MCHEILKVSWSIVKHQNHIQLYIQGKQYTFQYNSTHSLEEPGCILTNCENIREASQQCP